MHPTNKRPENEDLSTAWTPALKKLVARCRDQVDEALGTLLRDPNRYTHDVYRAMRYSLTSGGKRLRPVLCLLTCRLLAGRSAPALPVACALEYVHTYSLIHDDLPALDNDDFRRGKPTCHKKFGEATAILAGDALLTEAFALLSRRDLLRRLEPDRRLRIITEISRAAGLAGMIGGQEADLQAEGKQVSLDYVNALHGRKTGALIAAALVCGGLVGGGDPRTLKTLRAVGNRIGLAFQIQDDLLNVEGQSRLTGKATGTDALRQKATYPALIGLEESRRTARRLVQEAVALLKPFGPRGRPLGAMSYYIIARNR
ncbi:MAG: polyprenyl synthetase family protein [Desulfobacterota bacterium]|jgi:geranylgeranyl diphosphate synthase type II|nr:polyprenyl synthetase family protein [Thermodesulfobacteriota bacterium]